MSDTNFAHALVVGASSGIGEALVQEVARRFGGLDLDIYAVLPRGVCRSTFRDGQLDRFADLKAEVDPDRALRSGLAGRLFYED